MLPLPPPKLQMPPSPLGGVLPSPHASTAALLPIPANAPGAKLPPAKLHGGATASSGNKTALPAPGKHPVAVRHNNSARVDGDVSQGFVQVLLPAADDAQARVLFISRGVHFLSPTSMVPCDGVLNIHASPTAPHTAAAYRWRG